MKRSTLLLLLSVITVFQSCRSGVDPDSFIVSDFSPKSGPIGELVTIHGSGFPSNAESIHVTIGGKAVRIIEINSNDIAILIPEDASTDRIRIQTQEDAVETLSPFTVTKGFSFYPKNPKAGDTVTIYCAEFPSGQRSLMLNGQFYPTTHYYPRRLEFIAPNVIKNYSVTLLLDDWTTHRDSLMVQLPNVWFKNIEISLDSVVGLFTLVRYDSDISTHSKEIHSPRYHYSSDPGIYLPGYTEFNVDLNSDSVQVNLFGKLMLDNDCSRIERCFIKKIKTYPDGASVRYCLWIENAPCKKIGDDVILDLHGSELKDKLTMVQYIESYVKDDVFYRHTFDNFELLPNSQLHLKLSR